jgi:uncharacterized membrane protein
MAFQGGTMGVLDLITILLSSTLAGVELAVSWFFNPAIWQLDDRPQATALSLLARSLGKLMPFWYVLCFVLLSVEAYLRRHSPSHIFGLVALAIWLATILYTITTLVPINNRIAALTPASLPPTWKQDHKRWDTLHRWRILLLIIAVICLTAGILGLG